jgi:hypothetical protein
MYEIISKICLGHVAREKNIRIAAVGPYSIRVCEDFAHVNFKMWSKYINLYKFSIYKVDNTLDKSHLKLDGFLLTIN